MKKTQEAKIEKAPKVKKERKKRERGKLWKEFKTFINRGNALDLAVGVVIGGVFNAIVTSLVNILLSVATWGVPGGLSGLVTVLPALSPGQSASNVNPDWLNVYTAQEFNAMAEKISDEGGVVSLFTSSYTQHGSSYYYNGCAIIDWGAFINAVITFLIVATTLFVIVKVFNYLKKKGQLAQEKAKEEYYKKHPEERPVILPPGPAAPTETELLASILAELKKVNETKGISDATETKKIENV